MEAMEVMQENSSSSWVTKLKIAVLDIGIILADVATDGWAFFMNFMNCHYL